jgi:hypothetical protein
MVAGIWRGLLAAYVLVLRLVTGRCRPDYALIAELEVESGYRDLVSVLEDKALFAALWRSGRLRPMMDAHLAGMRQDRYGDHREIAALTLVSAGFDLADARDVTGVSCRNSETALLALDWEAGR